MSREQQIVPGIFVSSSGQATVDPSLADVLFDLAIKLEEPTNLPVDVEHVLAAVVWLLVVVVLAKQGRLSASQPIAVEICGMYWYYVGMLWAILFPLVYLN